jgi:hypothetical protein
MDLTAVAIPGSVYTANSTITLRDASGNPVACLTPSFSATDTGSTNTYGACSIGAGSAQKFSGHIQWVQYYDSQLSNKVRYLTMPWPGHSRRRKEFN